MGSLGDVLSEESRKNLTVAKVETGAVFLMPFFNLDGITPKDGKDYRYKWYVVLGIEDSGNVYGGVVINTKINEHLSKELIDSHIPIWKSKYSFLDHNSHINCSKLICKDYDFLLESSFIGKIEEEDVEVIINTIIGIGSATPKELKRFNIRTE
jgi:hypothetical protein